ncbi:MAG TPA: hypothetical protein VGH27_29865 [Streptosporangiaceae bacterium]
MSRSARWVVAGLVVLAVFAGITLLAGAVVLPHWRTLSAADRWVIATAAGLAVGALVALWGQSWATSDINVQQPAETAARIVQVDAPGNTGIVSTGDNAINQQER